MDIWIFIAAAGSGYLAQFWQSSQNAKGASGDITNDDDDDHSDSPSHIALTRKCHYVPSQKRKSAKRRFHQKRRLPKLSEGGGAILGGCLTTNLHIPPLDDSESWGVLALHNGVEEDACSCPSTPRQSERHYDGAHCYSMSGSSSPSRCSVRSSFDAIWPQKSCEFELVGNKVSSNLTGTFLDDCGCCMSNLYSKDHLDPCGINKVHDFCSIKSVKVKHESIMANEVRALSSNRTWRTGYHDEFEDVCAVGLSDAHIMQECEVKSSRNIRSHHENERGSCFAKRRRNCRPITFSGSYISAQLADDYRQEITRGHKHISLAHKQPLCQQTGEHSGILDVKAISSDHLVGYENSHFSSLRKMSSTVLNKINLPSMAGKQKVGTFLERSSPLYCSPSQRFNGGRKEASGDGFWLKGSGNNLLKMLLFNFGVGVGMMFAIMSNMHGSRQIIGQLEEAMSSLKGLEGEIQGRKKFRLGFNNNGDITENISPEQSPSVLQKVFGLVEQVRISLLENSGSVSAMDCDCSQERAKLEAELEAELERMELELDFNLKDTELCGRYSRANEDGLGIGNVFQGELSTRHFPCDIDAHSLTVDGDNFSHEFIHYGNCAVPPVELAKRLYEVLETRQEEKIMELEAEIKRLDDGLQAKEKQFQAWKQRKDFYVEAENTGMKDLYSSTSKEDLFVVGLERPVPLFPNNKDILSNPVENDHSMYPRISQAKTCCGNEASNNACEGWLQPLNNTGSGSPSHSHNGLRKDADKRDLRSTSMTVIQPEVMDVSYSSVSSRSSNNAVIDILGSASCSITSMDRETLAQEHLNNQLKGDVEVETSNMQQFFRVEWNRDGMPRPCPSQICAPDVIDIHDSRGPCGRILDWNTSEDSCNSSDLDEQLGQLLIKRIVQKGRKGVLMVEAAKSVMASFDLDNTSLEIGIPSG